MKHQSLLYVTGIQSALPIILQKKDLFAINIKLPSRFPGKPMNN